MDDLTETLTAMRNRTRGRTWRQTAAEKEALLSAVENVLALHGSWKPSIHHQDIKVCEGCGAMWPCNTYKALTDALGGSDE